MARAATANPFQMAKLLLALPRYETYLRPQAAMIGERDFRLCLAQLLQNLAGRLLVAVEMRGRAFGPQQYEIIEETAEDLGVLITHLNRRGAIRLARPLQRTVAELGEIDGRLVLLLEQTWRGVHALLQPTVTGDDFLREAQRLGEVLEAFAEASEERNQRLGLGWESEIGLNPFTGRRKE
jgi:hypothetical protein